jgi:hypothetical protein
MKAYIQKGEITGQVFKIFRKLLECLFSDIHIRIKRRYRSRQISAGILEQFMGRATNRVGIGCCIEPQASPSL